MRHDQRYCQGQTRSDGQQPSAPLRRLGCDGLRRRAAVGRRSPPAPLARSPSGPAQTPALVREHNCDACTPDAQSSSTCPAARPSKRGKGFKTRLRGKSKNKEVQPHSLRSTNPSSPRSSGKDGSGGKGPGHCEWRPRRTACNLPALGGGEPVPPSTQQTRPPSSTPDTASVPIVVTLRAPDFTQ